MPRRGKQRQAEAVQVGAEPQIGSGRRRSSMASSPSGSGGYESHSPHTKNVSSNAFSSPLHPETLRAAVLMDNSTVRWNLGGSSLPDDQGCVRSSQPLARNVPFFVFEVSIVALPEPSSATETEGIGELSVGIANFDSNGKLKSELAPTYTYSSKTGHIKSNLKTIKQSGAGVGDVIACGVSFMGHSAEPFVFFAKNGELLEPFCEWKAPSFVAMSNSQLFPFVSYTSGGISGSSRGSSPRSGVEHSRDVAVVRVNFDFASQEVDWRARLEAIESDRAAARILKVNIDADLLCEKIARDFLRRHGYIEALRAMDQETDDDESTSSSASAKINGASNKRNSPLSKAGQSPKSKRGLSQQTPVENGNNGTMEVENPSGKNKKKARQQFSDNGESPVKVLNGDEHDEEDDELQFARERRHIRTLVCEGRVQEAVKIVQDRWPQIMETAIGLDLRVHCLAALILERKYPDAIQFARKELWRYLSPELRRESAHEEETDDSYQDYLERMHTSKAVVTQAMGLFAHPDPKAAISKSSKFAALFSIEKRHQLADVLNRALLFHPNPPQEPALDKILAHMAKCAELLRERAGGYGEEFQL